MNPPNKVEGSSPLARLKWKVTGKRGRRATYSSPEASSTSINTYFGSRGYIDATDLMLLLAGRRIAEDFDDVVDEEYEAKRAMKGKDLMVLDEDKLDVDEEKEYEANRARKGKGLMVLDEDKLDDDEVYYLKNMGLLSTNNNHLNCDGNKGLIRALSDTKFLPSNSMLKIKGNWGCNVCGKTFANPQALGGHKSSHNKENSHNVGQTHLKKVNGYANNIGVHQANEQRKWSCDTCDKTFHTYQALGGHTSSHNKEKNNNIAQPNLRKVNDGFGFGSGVMVVGLNTDLDRDSSGSGGSREDIKANKVVLNGNNNVKVKPKLYKCETCVPSPEVSSLSLSYQQNKGKKGGERTVLEIDLNEPLSMMEEEDGDVNITNDSNLKSLVEL